MLQLLETENKGDLRSLAFNLPSTGCVLSYKDDDSGFLWFILKTKQFGNKL